MPNAEEIVKILTQLTALVKPELENLEKAYRFLSIVDFIRAKARFAQKIGAVLPQLENSRIIEYRNAEPSITEIKSGRAK